MARAGLFAEDASNSTALVPGKSQERSGAEAGSSPLGDGLHDLSDKQLTKLIALKFHSDPLLLIRQLSKDLVAKEGELVLLRKEKFQREQELVRLCTEYANLSTLEIDQRLNALVIEPDVGKVLTDMIGSAVSEDPRSEFVPRQSRPPRTIGARAKRERRKTEGSAFAPETPESTAVKKPLHWLDWLNPSDELLHAPGVNNRIRMLRSHGAPPVRDPVELESMGFLEEVTEAPPDSSTDKYGFYNELRGTMFPPSSNGSKSHLQSPENEPKSSGPETPNSNHTTTPDRTKSPDATALAEATVSNSSSVPITGAISMGRISDSIDRLKHLSEQHDAQNETLLRKWDSFMRDVSKESSKRTQQESYEMFGVKALNLKGPDTVLGKIFGEDERSDDSRPYRTLQRLVCESGIPIKHRNRMWFELSGAKNKEVPGEYQRLVELSHQTQDPAVLAHIDQINLDLHRTLPSNRFFNDMARNQPGPHFYRLQNILYAYAVYKPDVGYSQGMNKVVGNILLGVNEGNSGAVKLTEEDEFWIFVSLTEDVLPSYGDLNYFHQGTVPFVERDTRIVATEYMPQFLPHLHQHFTRLGVDAQVPLLGWWLGVFTDKLVSVGMWFHMFDGLLICEHSGVKMVSYSLAIFKVCEEALLAMASADAVYGAMSGLRHSKRFYEIVAVSVDFERHIAPSDFQRRQNNIQAPIT